MDRLIKRYEYTNDDDLKITNVGIAYQADMSHVMKYGENYFNKFLSYEGTEISLKINKARIELVARHYDDDVVLDTGIGAGEFIKSRKHTFGNDINKKAIKWLRDNDIYSKEFNFLAYTFWDVIEHIQRPEKYFDRIDVDSFLFTSIPIFEDLTKIRQSKHYKPNEHLYYFTEKGFVDYMALYGFRLLEVNDNETKAGRESIKSFAFKKDLINYDGLIQEYRILHGKRHYGASAYLYLDCIKSDIGKLNPKSVLDYGCGRSNFGAYFWKDGARRIERYDACLDQFKDMPEGKFDLVLCIDMMEHILMHDVDRIFEHIKNKSANVIFVISMIPARAKLLNGMNTHVTLLTEKVWRDWIEDYFGETVRIEYEHQHILVLKTWTQ